MEKQNMKNLNTRQWRTYELLKDGDFGIFNTNELV